MSGGSTGAGLPSLFWPPDIPHRAHSHPVGPEAADLDLGPLIHALSGGQRHREPVATALLTALCPDPGVIAYRAGTVTNLLQEPALRGRLIALLPLLAPLAREHLGSVFGVEWTVTEIVERLGELERYVEAADALADALNSPLVRSPGLGALRRAAESLVATPEFQGLRAELPDLRAVLDSVRSVTIGVNLSPGLQPESATILSVDAQRIEGRAGLLHRLLGWDSGRQGVTHLRRDSGAGLQAFFPPLGAGRGGESELVRDLRRLLERVAAPVGEAIDRYIAVQTRDFVTLEVELAVLLNGVALMERLRAAGLPLCSAEIAPPEERISCLEDAYNVSFALRMIEAGGAGTVVTNPISFDAYGGRVWILTGPNRGGKTTYARAVALAHLLFQAGFSVPARRARMSPIDALHTHFPAPEGATPGEGRLDEEAKRLAQIFQQATPQSLVLLNEVLSGTSTIEALALARDAVRGLRTLGVRAIYVTHLHDLAHQVEEINASTPGDGLVGSLVAGVEGEEHERTFRIRPGPPTGRSYASEIAEQHGISYRQIRSTLESRGVLHNAQDGEARA